MTVVGEGVVPISGDLGPLEKDLGKAEKGLTSKLGDIGKKAGKAFAAAGAVAGAALFKIGSDFDEQFDKIRVGTGATGKALEGLEGSFKNVLKNVPASFDDAGSAVADLNTRLGLTGKPLENLSGQFINLSRITKTDVASNIDNLTRTFGDWNIGTEYQSETLDKLYRASQASGIGIDELSQSLVTFGAPMRNLGFTMDQGTALLAQFNKTGVNTETVFAGLKAGVGKLAKEGEPVPETFNRIVKEITALGPGSEATGLAIELFGQRAGPDLADAITGGKFELEGMLDAIRNGEDTIGQAAKDTEDFGEKFTMLKNRVFVGLEPLARKVFDGVGNAMDVLSDWWTQNAPMVMGKVEAVKAAITGWIEEVGPPIKSWVKNVLGSMSDWWKDNGPTVIHIAETLRDGLVAAFRALQRAGKFVIDNWKTFKPILMTIGGLIATLLIPHYISLGVEATKTAAKNVKAWLTQKTAALRHGATILANMARQVAAWVLLGAQSLAHAAKVAAAWLIAMGPIGAVIAAVAGLVALIVVHWDTIKETIAKGWELVKQYTAAAWDWISEKVGDVVSAVVDFVKGLPQRAKDALSGAWATFSNFWSTSFTAIKTFVSDRIADVVGFIGGLPGRAKAALETAWTVYWTFYKTIFTAAATFVSDRISDVVGFVGSLPGRAKAALSAAWEIYKAYWSTVFNAARDFVSDRIADIIGYFTALPGRIVAAVKLGYDAIIGVGKWVVKTMVDGIQSILTLMSFFTGLPGKIVGWVMDKAESLLNLGKRIVEKIVEGITSMPGKIGDAIGDMVGKIKVPSIDIPFIGDGPGAPPGAKRGGSALSRVQSALGPGTYVTSTYRTPARNRAVGGSPTSYHMDRNNPAVDIGGSTAALDRLAPKLRAMGGWREFLWRVKGHYDHIHVAHSGGYVTPQGIAPLRSDELMTKLQVGETVLPKDFDATPDGPSYVRLEDDQLRQLARTMVQMSRAS